MAGRYSAGDTESWFSHVEVEVSLDCLGKGSSRLLTGGNSGEKSEPELTLNTLVLQRSHLGLCYGLDDSGSCSTVAEDGQGHSQWR